MRLLKYLVVLALILGGAAIWNYLHTPTLDRTEHATTSSQQTIAGELPAWLPVQARQTFALIRAGGPYPYRQDDGVFGNREKLLPKQPRGYYHEYTVETPGLDHRGARRIVTGGNPPVEYFYTDDHYRSFRRFEVAR